MDSMTGSGDQHQPTLTDKQRSVLLTARRKQLCERYALRLVSALSEAPRVPAQWLLDQLGFLTRSHYNDVTEERALIGLCGYALCGSRLFSDGVSSDTGWLSRQRWMRRQYAISTHTNRVYDIGERKRFCSNRCFRASRHIQLQVHTSPLWLRERDAMVRFHLLPDNENLSGVAGDIIPFTVQLPRVSDDDGVVEGSSNAGSDDNREKRDITSAEEMVSYIVDNYDELEARFNELSLDPTSERVDDTSDKETANRRVSHCLNIDQKSDCTDNSSVVSSTITPTTSVCVAPADPNIADSENGDESAKEHANVTSCGTITSDLSSSCSNRLSTNSRSSTSKRAVNGTSRARSRSHQKDVVFGSGRRCSVKTGYDRPVGDTSLAQVIARLEDWFSIGADTSETAHTASSKPNDTASSVEKSDLTVIGCQDRGTRCDEDTSQAASGGSQSDAGPNNTISADSVSQAIGGICCFKISSRIDDVNHPDSSTTDKSLPNVNRQEMELNNQMLLQFLQGKRVRFETNVEIKQTCPNSSVEPCQDKGVPQPNSEHVQSANNAGGDLLKTDVEESDRSRVTSRDSFTEEVEPVQLVPTVDSLDVARVRRRLFCRQIERCLSSLLPLVVGSPSLAAQLAASMRRFTAHMHLTATNVTLPSRLHTVTSVCLLRLLLRVVNSNRGNPDGVVLTEEQYARADRVVCRHLQSYGLDVPVLDRTIDNIASSKRFHNI